jgi:hypothetical protein
VLWGRVSFRRRMPLGGVVMKVDSDADPLGFETGCPFLRGGPETETEFLIVILHSPIAIRTSTERRSSVRARNGSTHRSSLQSRRAVSSVRKHRRPPRSLGESPRYSPRWVPDDLVSLLT